MYQALYRKWRPLSFDEVVGQSSVVETLKRQIVLDRLSHAYLFTGTRGTGKTTCAKILARAVNCENPVNGNPCNKCKSCVGIENGSIYDVIEMDAASNNGISDVRALRDEAIYSPAAVKKRVYIIDEVHMLSKDAFNALLKIMEEPPEHLIFILATTELHKVPATVLSRCQRYSFRRLPPPVISERLSYIATQEKLNLPEEAAALLSRLADGSMRDGISLLDQCSSAEVISVEHVLESIGLAGRTETENLLEATQGGDTAAALSILDRLYNEGKDVASVLEELCTLLRDILITKIAPSGGWSLQSGGYDGAALKKLASEHSATKLMKAIEIIQTVLTDINKGGSRKIMAELCLMRLCGIGDSVGNMPSYEQAPIKRAVPERTVPAPRTEAPVCKSESELESKPTAESNQQIRDIELSVPEKSGEVSWQGILNMLNGKVDMLDFIQLSDPTRVEGELAQDVITIKAKSPFDLGMLQSNKMLLDAVKAAGETLLGNSVRVVVTGSQKTAVTSDDKLDALSKFDNIKFK